MCRRTRLIAAAAVLAAGGAAAGSATALGLATGSPVLVAEPIKLTPLSCTKGASTLTVQGQGTASATPDQMVLTISVHTQSASAKTALASNATKAHVLISTFEKQGVPGRQLQTTGLDLEPTYDNSGTITGYAVDDTITATTNNLANAGTLIDAAVGATGNSARLQGISFSVQHQDVVLAQARATAVHQAATLAAGMARADGLEVGPLCALQDNTTSSTSEPQPLFASAHAAVSTPVQAGTQQFNAQISATYELEH